RRRGRAGRARRRGRPGGPDDRDRSGALRPDRAGAGDRRRFAAPGRRRGVHPVRARRGGPSGPDRVRIPGGHRGRPSGGPRPSRGIGDTDRMSELAPFLLSLRVAAMATLLIVAFGLPAAWVLARRDFPGKALIAGILILPLVLPPTVLGYYLLQVLGRRAPIGHWLESALGVTVVFHWSGAVIASAGGGFPPFLPPARGAVEPVAPGLRGRGR